MTIKQNEILIYPTDTVWGIGCSLYSEEGFKRIAEIKKTNSKKPLSIMFASIEDIYKSFHFDSELNLLWLKEFFKLETTLGLSLKSSKIQIPKWATGASQFASIRCVDTPIIRDIYNKLRTPFFTTSLNITGEPPIINDQEAFDFYHRHVKDAHFFANNTNDNLSGSSSTIVFLKENLDFEIVREGLKAEQVKNHLAKLFEC